MSYQFEQIKVVIWDLDETLWQGTLDEGAVRLPATHREAVCRFTDAGIINSICSKNDFERAEAELRRLGIWDYFVFPSIAWTAKGPRVARQLQELQLRAPNVLFIDDNHLNREEVKFHCLGVMVATPEDIPALHAAAGLHRDKDPRHSRLNQYRMLETKASAQKEFATNEAFLLHSAIRVEVHEDCLSEASRIHDLVMRSNQLNFTKKRVDLGELTGLLRDESVRAGYVTVSDRFGDYGITGFFAVHNGELQHFLFSCRTLGMGVEQYVYNLLGRPQLRIAGEVASDLSSTEHPNWINRSKRRESAPMGPMAKGSAHSVLLKGPCDIGQIVPFIQADGWMDTELTYISPKTGVAIEPISHTTHVVQALTLTDEQKQRVIAELPFADANMYSDRIFRHPYRVVFLSILADANLGVYRRRATGELVAFTEAYRPLTDPGNWDGYARGEYFTANCKLTREFLNEFYGRYEFIGANTPEQIIQNLSFIRASLPTECLLVVLLGSEMRYEQNRLPAYHDRHLVHKRINDAIRRLCAESPNLQCLDVNRHLSGQHCYWNNLNHYIKPVYYQLAQDIIQIINQHSGAAAKSSGKSKLLREVVKQKVKALLGRA